MIQFEAVVQPNVCKRPKGVHQLTLSTSKADIAAPSKMDVAIADSIHNSSLPFCLSKYLKLMKMIDIAQRLHVGYKAPYRMAVFGYLLTSLANESCKESICTLLKEANGLGATTHANGATIAKIPYVDIIDCVVNNTSWQINVHKCTYYTDTGLKKCGCHLASILIVIIR